MCIVVVGNPLRELLGLTDKSPFLIIDHIEFYVKINLVCCAALAVGKNVYM